MIFASQTSSHFMTAETFMVYLHGLLTPALSLQRKKLGVASSTMALLLCDAWTGFHACKNGLDAAREGWSKQACCILPDRQDRYRAYVMCTAYTLCALYQ